MYIDRSCREAWLLRRDGESLAVPLESIAPKPVNGKRFQRIVGDWLSAPAPAPPIFDDSGAMREPIEKRE